VNIFGRTLGMERVEVDEHELRAARAAAARRTKWREFSEGEFVRRGPRGAWLVHEPTDEIFVLRRGSVFADRATIEFAREDDPSIAYFVTADERVVALERVPHPRTWSEHVARQARRAARTRPAV
jgi:hypothetical protein